MSTARVVMTLLLCAPGMAAAWQYSQPISISETRQPHTFYHLESSGNRSIAISKSEIAVVWEDNRSGKPEIYLAIKSAADAQFSQAVRINETTPAYEPVLAAIGEGKFVVVWEAADQLWTRVVSAQQMGAIQPLAQHPARQATLTTAADGQLWLAWAGKTATHYQIMVAAAKPSGDQLQLAGAKAVEKETAKADQLYPTLVVNQSGVTVGWEDRRFGHTRLYTAFARTGKWFAQPQQINYVKPWSTREFGKGTGAMRVVLASDGAARTFACWLDKRDFSGGYDVYAAMRKAGDAKFGDNEKVQDLLGENQAQWHAVSAMDQQGHAVVAWDDQRDGTADIWFSWRKSGGWSDDETPAGANGEGSQSHPAMVFDDAGRLHLVFVDRGEAYSAIRYLVATPTDTDFAPQP